MSIHGGTWSAAVVLLAGGAWAQPTLERIPIPGYSSVNLYRASGDGRWVTGFVADSTGWRAFRASTSTFEVLEVPPDQGTIGYALSHDGSVMAGERIAVQPYAIRWTPGGMEYLGPAGIPGARSAGLGISGDGRVVVGTVREPQILDRAFRWTPEAGIEMLEFEGTVWSSRAEATNTDGSVIVGTVDLYEEANSRTSAFRWTAEDGARELESLVPLSFTWATAVSADGRIVAGFSGGGDGNMHSVRWTEAGIEDLGVFGPVRSITADGAAIVGDQQGPSGITGYYWTRDLGVVLLRDYIGTLGLSMGDWNVGQALGISTDGTRIAFSADRGVESAPFILTIPAPGSLGLLGLGVLIAVRRRRKRA